MKRPQSWQLIIWILPRQRAPLVAIFPHPVGVWSVGSANIARLAGLDVALAARFAAVIALRLREGIGGRIWVIGHSSFPLPTGALKDRTPTKA
jgi:hypothetical protein